MKKVRYLLLAVMLLPACQVAVTPPVPSESTKPSGQVSFSPGSTVTTPSPQDSSNLNTNNTGTPSPVPTSTPTEEIPLGNNNSQPEVSPTPSHHGNMPGPGSARCVSIVPLTQEEIDRGCTYLPPQPHPTPVYSNNYPIPEGLTEGNINIIFKDEYKVRYDKERKSFYSLNSSDVTNINSIISMLSFEEVIGRFDITEEQAEEREKRLEKNYGYDSVNQKSSYWLNGVKNTDIKTLIEKIRQNSLVRESNLDTGAHPD